MKHFDLTGMTHFALIALFASTGCNFSSEPTAGLGNGLGGLIKAPEFGRTFQWPGGNLQGLQPRPRPQEPAPAPTPAVETCSTSGQATMVVESSGSFGALSSGSVEISANGNVVARGAAYDQLGAPAGCPVQVRVTFDGLADRPSVTLSDVVPDRGQVARIPVQMGTGLVRVQALIDGRRISGVARLYRVDGSTGRVGETPAASFGANDSSREISAGSYEVRLLYRGQTLIERVTIVEGQSRRVTLEG